jgi:hypothetical protein
MASPSRSTARLTLAVPLLLWAVPWLGLKAQVDSAVIPALRDARRIRLELANRVRFEGRFQELSASTLSFQAIVRPTIHESYFAERQVPLDSLSRIWVQDGSHWRTGALVGGAAVGLFGFLVGMTFQGDLDTPTCSQNAGGCVVGLTAAGAALGAVSGGLLGALFIRWRLVWRL